MKHFILFIAFILAFHSYLWSQTGKQKVVVFEIKEEIAPSATRITRKAFDQAQSVGAQLVIIKMNTYGGLVTDADSIATIISTSPIETVVWIESNAASAGALISIACDRIYMKPGASIGAATVVNQSGEKAPDKYQSYMRGKMRSLAETHCVDTFLNNKDTCINIIRNPKIAEAMVDEDIFIPNIIDSSKILTFTVEEAMANGYCEGKIDQFADLLKTEGLEDAEIINVKKSTIDVIFGFLANPAIRGLFILMIFGGLYYELQAPGIGFALGLSILGAILYFAPLYIDGLAENWEILIFIVGLGFIALEIFVIPGFGVAGISGLTLVFAGLILALVRNVNFDFSLSGTEAIGSAMATVSLSILAFIAFLFLFGKSIIDSNLFKRIVLAGTLENAKASMNLTSDFDNQLAVTYTDLRPMGKVMVDGELYEAKTYGGFIEKNTQVKILKKEFNYLIVEEA